MTTTTKTEAEQAGLQVHILWRDGFGVLATEPFVPSQIRRGQGLANTRSC